jgi:5-methylcytosine-specific restriction protein A
MATFLFAWNPKIWNWPDLPDYGRRIARKGFVDAQWASGRTRQIEPGSRAFMVRLGVPPKGIIGSGVTLTAPVLGPHWRDDKIALGIQTLHLDIRWEALFELPQISFDELAVPPFSRFRWATRASGMRIPTHVADALEDLWEKKLAALKAVADDAKAAPARKRRQA